MGEDKKSVVTGVEMFRKLLDQGEAGDNVGLLLRGAVDLRYVRYIPRLFEHVYTGTKADKKRALEASDIGALVCETEMDLSKRIPSSRLQKAKMLFVFMFMMRGLPFVDLAFLRKKDLQGNVLSYRRRKTGHTLRVLLSPEALQLVRMVSNKDENSPIYFQYYIARRVPKRLIKSINQL
ncbi:hypothetical protein [Bacteroides sp. CACC 737]|uniref:hypothetical protein n=1 Tax=Bacteroides sp. CACC 737 TaxID=2755405 RepID=UPI00351B55BB